MTKIINQLIRLSIFASHHNDPRASFLPFDFRPSTFGLLLIFSFLILNCGIDVEDPTPLPPPVWVQKSLPEEWPERGIDAHESVGIYLEWEVELDNDIIAYKIYRADYDALLDSVGRFEQIFRLESEGMITSKYIDTNIELNKHYIYKLKSENTAGDISTFSEPGEYTLLPQISLIEMVPNGRTETMRENAPLSWIYEYGLEMEDYIITLVSEENELVIRSQFSPGNYIGGRDYWRIPKNASLIVGDIYKWRIEVGAHYFDGWETAGSESAWANFLYIGQ